jgi:hypothetical protein
MKRWFMTVTLGLSGLLCLAFGSVALADGAGYTCTGGYTTCNYVCYPSGYTCNGSYYATINQKHSLKVGGCEPSSETSCTNTMLQCDIDCYRNTPCPSEVPDCATVSMISGCKAP